MSEWITLGIGLRQGYLMLSWLFNVYMNGEENKMKVTVLTC